MNPRKIRRLWLDRAPQYWWGDPLDVRLYICEVLSGLKGKRILDLGCNVGIILNCADDSNEKVGVDLDREAIKLAREINKQQGRNASFHVLDLFDAHYEKPFDVVILSNMIEMFPAEQRPEVIRAASSHLRTGGLLILTTPNVSNSYYAGTDKLSFEELVSLLPDGFQGAVKAWNPFPIQLGHLLHLIPGFYAFLRYLSRRGIAQARSVAFIALLEKT